MQTIMNRGGIYIFLALVLFTINPISISAQQCGEPLHAEFLEADRTLQYEAFIEQYSPCELAFVAVQRLAGPHLMNKRWQGAIDVFKKYQGKFPGMKARFNAIISILGEPEEGLLVQNLGPGINTRQGEFRPVLSADGQKLYFARNCGECEGGEDIFVSRLNGDYWDLATEVGKPVSTKFHEMPTGISSGGNTLLLFGNYSGSFGRGDIFYAEKNATCWSDIKHYPDPINTEFFESDAVISADSKAILFVSERPGNKGKFQKKGDFFHGSYGGNTDIYVYVDPGNGALKVINLGETINTPYSEYSPFIHPDGKTLYFSSDGHYGLGGLDVYKSTRLSENSWTQWSKPVNLGKEINGPFNDWGYQISTAGDVAYFSVAGKAGGFGENDIYSVGMPAKAKPKAVVTVSGKVTDPEGNPLNAQLQWNDLSLMKLVGENSSDPQTGMYFIALPAGRQYSYSAEKEGYIGRSEHFDLRAKDEFDEYRLDIVLYPADRLEESETAIRFNNIFFDFDKYELRKESFLELKRWVDFLKKNERLTPEVQGHTDSIGTDDYNLNLSKKRAQAVANYLVQQGIKPERISSTGFGESKPIAPNDSDAGRQMNRRVEIRFSAKSPE